jgi:hypothetical protein
VTDRSWATSLAEVWDTVYAVDPMVGSSGRRPATARPAPGICTRSTAPTRSAPGDLPHPVPLNVIVLFAWAVTHPPGHETRGRPGPPDEEDATNDEGAEQRCDRLASPVCDRPIDRPGGQVTARPIWRQCHPDRGGSGCELDGQQLVRVAP